MRRAVSDAIAFAVLGGIAVAAIASAQPGDTDLAVDAYLLFLGALALSVLTRATRQAARSHPSELERHVRARPRRWRRRRRTERRQLPELARLERELSLASLGAFDLHVRLRPQLREVAAHRLLSRHGIGLDEEPRPARELLGETAWDVCRPDRNPPEDHHSPGLTHDELREVVEALERL